MRKTFLFALTAVWTLGTVLAFFTGRQYEHQRIAQHLREQQRKARERATGRMGPGDRDPRRGGR